MPRLIPRPSGLAPVSGQNGVHSSNPVDRADLGNCHAIFHQGADAAEFRPRNRAHRLPLGGGRRLALLMTDPCGPRDYRQHTRFAGRPDGRRQGFRYCWRADRWWLRGEQGLGRLAAPIDLRAIVVMRLSLLLSAKQDLLRNGGPIRDMRRRLLIRARPVGSRQLSRKRWPEPFPLSNVSTKYRCHHLCHLQMTLGRAAGEAVLSFQTSA